MEESGKFVQGAWVPVPKPNWPYVVNIKVPTPTLHIMIGDLQELANEYGVISVDHSSNMTPRLLLTHWSGDYDLAELMIAGLQELREIRRRLRILGCNK